MSCTIAMTIFYVCGTTVLEETFDRRKGTMANDVSEIRRYRSRLSMHRRRIRLERNELF